MNSRNKVIKTMLIGSAIMVLPYVVGACKNVSIPLYSLDPTEPTVTEATSEITESTVETTVPTETSETVKETEPMETTIEETIVETTVPTETSKPTATAVPTKKATATPKATTKKTTKKKTTKKKSTSSGGNWWDNTEDVPIPTKKSTKTPTKKPTNTPTPKPYTYCTCDAVVNCGSKAAGTFHEFTLKGLTAHKTSAGVWKLTDSSYDKLEAYLEKNYPHSGGYGVKKLTNKRDYRYKA